MPDTNGAIQQEPTMEDLLRECAVDALNPEMEGAAAWNAYFQYQSVLLDNGYPLDSDDGYKIGGFHSYHAFTDAMDEQALFEARRLHDVALEKIEDIKEKNDEGDLDDHPYLDLMAALDWLKKSQYPLFSEDTYAELDTTRTDFFETLASAHISAARQKIGRAVLMMDKDVNPDEGIALVVSAKNRT